MTETSGRTTVSTHPSRRSQPQCQRTPRDPNRRLRLIDGLDAAIRNISLAIAWPLRLETIVLLLDADHVGHTIVVVDGCSSPEAVLDVAEYLDRRRPGVGPLESLVICSVRPGGSMRPADVQLWRDLDTRFTAVGIELLEWIVATDNQALLPRVLADVPARWPRGHA